MCQVLARRSHSWRGSHAGSCPECCFVQHVEGTAGESWRTDVARLGETGQIGRMALERVSWSGKQLKNLKVSSGRANLSSCGSIACSSSSFE